MDDWPDNLPVTNRENVSPECQAVCDKIWKWFRANGLSNKEKPTFYKAGKDNRGKDETSHRVPGTDQIIINDEQWRTDGHPQGAINLEEVLHYVLESEKPESSLDFNLRFWEGIIGVITYVTEDDNELLRWTLEAAKADTLTSREDRKNFQDKLIDRLWEVTEECTKSK